MLLLLMTVAAILTLPIIGAVAGWVQLQFYRQKIAKGLITADDVPFFGILMFRGMLFGFVVLALLAIAVAFLGKGSVTGVGVTPSTAPAP